jgi:hypothetical protein
MQTTVIIRDVVGYTPYWASDDTLPQARARFKRLTGKFPSSKATIVAFAGESKHIDAIIIDDLGDIRYNKALTKIVIQ